MKYRFGVAVCMALAIHVAQAAPDAARIVAKNAYSFKLGDGTLSGPGADFLMRATASAQFVLAGESHDDHDTPLFDLALLGLLHRVHGFDHVVVEQDPLGIEAILQPPLRGDAAKIGQFLHRYPTLLGFASDQDLEFLAGASNMIAGPEPIWGVEQAQSPVRYFELLAPLAPTAAAHDMDEALLAHARKLEPTRADFGKFLWGDTTALDRLHALQAAYHAPAGSRADILLTGLVKSAEIYGYDRRARQGEPVGLYNNTVREAWLKNGFIAHYRLVAAEGGGMPKAFFKFGANHVVRGLNFTGAYSLSTFAHELAIYEGAEAYGIEILPVGGVTEPGDLNWMKTLIAALPPGPVVIDTQVLRPQWKLLANGLGPEDRNLFRTHIFGFEAIVYFPASRKASWHLTGFSG
jgi:hypothetical protein